jgi:hypothetical protein
MNALVAWVLIVAGVAGAVALLRAAYLHWGRRGIVGGVALLIAVLVTTQGATGGLIGIALGGPHPCNDGRICIPTAGISMALAPGWSQISAKHGDEVFTASWNGSRAGPGIILRRARDVLGSEPGDIDSLDETANKARTGVPGQLSFVWSSASSRVTTPIGPAVRIEFVDRSLIFTEAHCVDHWFFSNGRAWVLTYVALDGTGGGGLDVMIDSLRLLEPST